MNYLSGHVQLNPGPETGSNNSLFGELRSVTSYGRRFVSIEHSNVRGLLRNLPERKLLIKQTKLDILIFSETNLTENVLDNRVFINGYQLLLSNRCGKASGGVAIYSKDNLNCVRITKYDVPNLEAIWIEVTWISQRLLVGCVYRPPDCTDFFGKFHSVVEKMWQSKKNVVMVGDLNADQLSSNWNGSKLKRIFQAFNFQIVIHNPKRIAATSSTLRDLILTNNLPKIFKSGVSDNIIADHKFVFTVFMFKKQNEEVYTFRKLTESKQDWFSACTGKCSMAGVLCL